MCLNTVSVLEGASSPVIDCVCFLKMPLAFLWQLGTLLVGSGGGGTLELVSRMK